MATGPAYMNAITSHPKVKTTITLLAPLFVAGQEIAGKVELECKAEREVGIGLIMIELLAAQELNSRDHTAATTFIHSRRVFQGPGLPPSNAVYDHTLPQDPSFPPSYFPGRKGITTFFFKFPTPISSPSSVSFASDLAKIEYKIRASVGLSYRGDSRLLSNSVNAELVQFQDMEGTTDEHVVVGEGGKVYVRGKLVGGRVIMGEKGCLELHVKNQTTKKTTGLTLTLTRSLHLHGAGASIPVQLTDTVFSESFKTAEYCVPPGIEGVANLVFDVPSATRVVKGGVREDNADSSGTRKQTDPLFELRCYLTVKIGMGLGSKDIMFEMPIQVKHRAVLGKDPVQDLNAYLSPVSPEPVFNRALSPILPHSPRALSPLPNPHANLVSPVQHTGQTPVPAHSPIPHYAQYNQPPPKPTIHPPALNPGDPAFARAVSPHLWSPTSPAPTSPYHSQSPLPAYYFPPPPVQLLPFAYPARPSSADPYYYPYHQIQNNVPSGLPPLSGSPAFYSPYPPFQPPFQYQAPLIPASTAPQPFTSVPPPVQTQAPQTPIQTETQPELPSTSSRLQPQPDAESGDQPAEGKGERASRIAQRLHVSTRARSMSPTSHRFPISSIATTKQPPPQKITLPPARLHATSPRHPVVLSPRPVVSPSRTYFGESPGRIGNGTAKSNRVDLLEQLVDLAPGDEEKSVEEVLRDLEEAEKKQQDKKDGPDSIRPEPLTRPGPPSGTNTRQKNVSLLDVFNSQPPVSKDSKDNSLSPSLPQLRKGSVAAPNNVVKPDTRNEGLDALEKRLLQDVGTRKPEAIRPTIFDLGLLDKSTMQSPSEQPSAKQENVESPPPSPHTVRLHPRQFRESQISELALGYDVDGNKDRVDPEPLSPVLPRPIQSHEEEKSRKTESEQSNKGVVMRDEAKGRVSEWLGGLPQFSSSPTRAEAAPMTYLAEPTRAPPRKRSIDGVLGFFGIGKNKSREDLRATSPVIASSSVRPKVSEQSDVRTELSKSIDMLASPSQSTSTNLPPKPPSMPKELPKPKDKPSPGVLSQSTPTNPSPVRNRVYEQSVSGESSKSMNKLAIPVQPSSAPATSLQNRAPSPSRKPVPKHVKSALDGSFRKLEVDSAPKPRDAFPRRLSDAPPILKPTVKAGQINGAATKETPVTQPNNKMLPNPKAASSTKVTEMQPALRINEVKLPMKPIKPEELRDKSTQAIATPARTPKPIPPPKPNLQIREGMKNKGTLPSVPISTQQRLNLAVSDPETKYDVRSARGGRGGIATSVAAIWASRAEGNDSGKENITSSPVVSRDGTAQNLLKPPRPGEAKPNSTSITPTALKVVLKPNKVEEKDSPALSAKSSRDPIKGASVPAQVDRYHAKPQLSSVATLAHPVLSTKYKPPSLSMTLSAVPESTSADNASSTSSSAKAGEIPLGQTRLKELIKKYQQAAL